MGDAAVEYIKDAPFADVFICNGELDFHDYYYISPIQEEEDSIYYRVNRTGIESRIPSLFFVERDSTMICCEVFCIFSGKGQLTFRGKSYELGKNQVIVLPAGEEHSYRSDEAEPLGMSWVEFYGGDSRRLTRHIVDTQGPVIEGMIFSDASAALGILQQKLMIDERQNVSREIYSLLLEILKNENRYAMAEISQDVKANFSRVEAYIDAHLKDGITNGKMADVCGISLPYFIKQFKIIYRMTPQEFVMNRRLRKGKQMLMQTRLPVDEISEILGFCNTSHFIRRFREKEKMTPAQYRGAYRIE